MSEQQQPASDRHREWLVALAERIHNEGRPPGVMTGDVLDDVLAHYDADRERAAKALALVERIIWWEQVIQRCGTDCPEWERCRAKSTCRYQLTPKLAEREGIIEPPAYTNGGTP
jgi:hypothetical protein